VIALCFRGLTLILALLVTALVLYARGDWVLLGLLVGRLVCNHHFKKCQLADLKLITMSFYGDMQTKRPTRESQWFRRGSRRFNLRLEL
jgi:hypothetical protein